LTLFLVINTSIPILMKYDTTTTDKKILNNDKMTILFLSNLLKSVILVIIVSN